MTLSLAFASVRPPIEHLGFDETHPKTWRKGHTCDDCVAFVDAKKALQGAGPQVNFNIERLRADNAGGYTQLGLAKDTYDAARRSGNDITAVR